jgi:hypothetical protein
MNTMNTLNHAVGTTGGGMGGTTGGLSPLTTSRIRLPGLVRGALNKPSISLSLWHGSHGTVTSPAAHTGPTIPKAAGRLRESGVVSTPPDFFSFAKPTAHGLC